MRCLQRSLVCGLVLASASLCAAEPAAKTKTGKRWLDMDYGPFLTASIGTSQLATNIAYKGIAINLGAAFGGEHNEAIVFDTDLLRYAAGWTGNFVALKGVAFDGEHWAYPRADGPQVFGNPRAPGWASSGRFDDPRPQPFGPLPREWAHWNGLYLHERKVILSYTVGDASVLEMPSLERRGDVTAFARTINLGPSAHEQIVQVAFDTRKEGAVVDCENQTVALLAPRDSSESLAVGVVGVPAAWLVTGSNVRLRLPVSAKPLRFKVLLWSGPRNELPTFARVVKSATLPADLAPLTRGGPARWKEKLVTPGRLGANDGPYAIDTLTAPDENPWNSWLRFSGVDFFANGRRAALCTWNGDVWIVSGVDGSLGKLTWQRVATGLFQPLGLKIVDDRIYVLGRDQVTVLRDLNGDGEADFYQNFNNDCMVSEHFHEFATDLKLGPDGNFYYVKCGCHGRAAMHAHNGTLLRLSRDGSKLEVVARGFRAANGIGIGPRGEMTCIDNQGHWTPANRINWIKPGGWYGYQWAWNPDQRSDYDEPLCWMHNFVDRSGGTQLWVPTDEWGPLKDELITISYGMGHMFHLLKEEVGGIMQGGVTRFPLDFETGVMRGVFHPKNHQLYTCGLYGWASNKTNPGGFYRVRYTGKPLHMPSALHIASDGVLLGFTDPLDTDSATDPGNYDVKCWNYHWTEKYGSPDFKRNGQEGRDTLTVTSATLSADRKTVFLKLPGLEPVMQMHIVMNLKAANGALFRNFVHHTIHKLGPLPGREQLGAGVIARAAEKKITLRDERAGLIQTITSQSNASLSDTRRVRLAALHVPDKTPPTPYVSAGPFEAKWSGFLKLDLNDEMVFRLEGRGAAQLRISGALVLDAAHVDGAVTRPVALRGGLNRFELVYESSAKGDAELRFFWSSRQVPAEPVPPTAFVHDAADAALAEREQAREGRALFASHRCAKCHRVDGAWDKHAMPELAADAPQLNGIGSRLNEAWIAKWLADPKAIRRDALMPRMVTTDTAARDVAAFLASLRETNSLQPLANSIAVGEKLFSDLGCVACHVLPGDKPINADTRIALGHVKAKWQPGALEAFLRAPGRRYPWIRMPDFKLSATEAAALAAYLFSRNDAAPASFASGDAARGRTRIGTLGCLNCHVLDSEKNIAAAPALADLLHSDWKRGCLADNAVAHGKAPDFGFSDTQRAALRQFARTEALASLQRDTPAEFAARQYVSLRCNACHKRDDESDVLSALQAAADAAAGKKKDEEESGKSIHIGRPPLTFAGEKLWPEWMERFIGGTLAYKPRSELQGRMPAFAAYATGLAHGFAHQHGYSAKKPPLASSDQQLAVIGKQLIAVSGGFSCVSCHDVGSQKALAGKDTATVNFAYVADRLRPGYYWRYVQDPPHVLASTMMPKFIGDDGTTPIKAIYNGDPKRQFTAIWNFLLSLRNASK